jgi:hypothetical protein
MAKYDIMLVDGKHHRLQGDYKVRVNLSELGLGELERLQAGIESELYRRERQDMDERCWLVPADAVEVFLVRDSKDPELARENLVCLRGRALGGEVARGAGQSRPGPSDQGSDPEVV